MTSDGLFCHKIIPNCLNYDPISVLTDPINCAECLPKFYLDTNQNCLSVSIVDNCKKYFKTSNYCEECDSDYLLNHNNCVKKALVEFCIEYEIVETKVQCLKCFESAYLDSSKNCQKREYSLDMIQNCTSLEEHNDYCKSCSEGFDLSSDKHSCLPLPAHCSEHSLSVSFTFEEYYKCSQCDEPFSLDVPANTCYTPITGCSQYNSSFDKCILCETVNYFLEASGKCTSRVFKPVNCSEFLPVSEGCRLCQESFTLTSDALECLPSINFCQVLILFFLIYRFTTLQIKIQHFYLVKPVKVDIKR